MGGSAASCQQNMCHWGAVSAAGSCQQLLAPLAFCFYFHLHPLVFVVAFFLGLWRRGRSEDASEKPCQIRRLLSFNSHVHPSFDSG
jgi:hypothetical protein